MPKPNYPLPTLPTDRGDLEQILREAAEDPNGLHLSEENVEDFGGYENDDDFHEGVQTVGNVLRDWAFKTHQLTLGVTLARDYDGVVEGGAVYVKDPEPGPGGHSVYVEAGWMGLKSMTSDRAAGGLDGLVAVAEVLADRANAAIAYLNNRHGPKG